ncbi:hypothetical protein IW262DRAFT_1465211 [Armillaria fumosa]|nr:hypothetical protein IW262DRAFT_1465211 [Armillaria fumosa]
MLIHLFLSLIGPKFDSARYPGFLKFIDRFEVDIPFHGLVGSYTAGMHPYFEMQSSILNLPSTKGEHFYGCLLDIIRAFEYRYPRALLSPTLLPIAVSLHSPPTLFHARNGLPFEVLERIFSMSCRESLLVCWFVCHDWCLAACTFTHCYIRLRMNADWQHWVGGVAGKRHAELYAFTVECAVAYISHKWQFASQRIREVVYHGKTCQLRSYPVIGYPHILPPSIDTLRLIRCSFRAYSVERMLVLCRNLWSVTIHSTDYGHVMAPLACTFTADDIAEWLSTRGGNVTSPCGALELYRPSITHLSLHVPDASYFINSTASDTQGTPPLLFQLFPVHPPFPGALYFLWDDKAFPVWLCTSAVQELDLVMSAHMRFILPHVILRTGPNVTLLCLIFPPTAYTRNAGMISLVGFASLLELHVEVPPSDLESVMLGCATWSSLARSRPESQFTICLSHVGNGPQVERALADPLILSVLCGMDTNDHHPLQGVFGLSLRAVCSPAAEFGLRGTVRHFLTRIAASDSVCATIGDALFLPLQSDRLLRAE